MIKNRKKLNIFIVIAVVVLAVIIWGATILLGNYSTQKLVTFEPKAGSTITFGTQNHDDPVIAKEIIKTKTKISKNLLPGNYVAIFSKAGYITQAQAITVDDTTTIKTPALNYTNERLAEILNLERSAIHAVVFSTVNDSVEDNSYAITDESLYGQADWYFANVTPTPPNNDGFVDLKVILKKSGNIWKASANPETIFWVDNYPNVPQNVIRAANKLGFY